MARATFKGVRIRGIAAAVPADKVDNMKEHSFCAADEKAKIVALTGIREYRKSPPDICASDLCEASAISLFDGLNISPSDIDAIVFATMTPDYIVPSTACILQDRLGCSNGTVAYDINMGCSGYVVGLFNACSLITGADLERVLLLAGDTQTKLCHDEDKNVVFILADGGTATIVEKDPQAPDINIEIFTDGSRFRTLYVPAGGCRRPSTEDTRRVYKRDDGALRSDENIYMDGMEIFKFSSTDVVKSISSFMEESGLGAEDIDYLVLHQANKFMNDKIARKLGFGPKKVLYSIDVYGNTAAASIPLTIAHNYKDMKTNGCIRTLISGFGVGLSWGVADLTLKDIFCPDIIEVRSN